MKVKHTLSDFQELAKSKGYECLANSYTNAHTPELCRCNKCKHEWKISYHNLRSWGCPKCAGLLTKTLLDFQELAKLKGCECLSTSYINSRTLELCRCNKCKYEWKISYHNLRSCGCPKCAGKLIKTLLDFKELAKIKGYECLAASYTNSGTPELCRCNKCKHEWKIRYGDLRKGNGCPKCAKHQSKPELYLYEIVKFSYPEALSGKRGILENKMFQLDIYIPSLKKAIEFDGDYWHKSELATKNMSIDRDLRKNIECKDANIQLLRVSDSEFNSDKEKTIIKMMNFLENSLNLL